MSLLRYMAILIWNPLLVGHANFDGLSFYLLVQLTLMLLLQIVWYCGILWMLVPRHALIPVSLSLSLLFRLCTFTIRSFYKTQTGKREKCYW